MKLILCMTLSILSMSALASVDGMRVLSELEAKDVRDAIIHANDYEDYYGFCNLKFIGDVNKTTYVDDRSDAPIVVVYGSSQFMKISVDPTATRIVDVVYGTLETKRVNSGTIRNPKLTEELVELYPENCKR